MNIPVFQGSQWDGVVGLGHCIHSNCTTSIEQDSIIDNIFAQDILENPIFTYYIKVIYLLISSRTVKAFSSSENWITKLSKITV